MVNELIVKKRYHDTYCTQLDPRPGYKCLTYNQTLLTVLIWPLVKGPPWRTSGCIHWASTPWDWWQPYPRPSERNLQRLPSSMGTAVSQVRSLATWVYPRGQMISPCSTRFLVRFVVWTCDLRKDNPLEKGECRTQTTNPNHWHRKPLAKVTTAEVRNCIRRMKLSFKTTLGPATAERPSG